MMATENQSASKEAGKTPLTTNTVDQLADAKAKDMKAEVKAPESKAKEPDAKAKEPDPKDESKASKAQGIRAVHGEMVDPHTGLRFTRNPSELFKKTPWVQAQIEAKKLELVDL